MAEETCKACGGLGTVRAYAAQGEMCPTCEGRGTVRVADAPPAPMTVDAAIEADLAKSVEPGEPPKGDAAPGEFSVAAEPPIGTVVHVLVAFDVDGTLDTSAGPVSWARVRNMASRSPSMRLGIVSPSGARPQDDTPEYLPDWSGARGGSRQANLRAFAAAFPTATIKTYVSNNGDMVEAEAAGFLYVDAQIYAAWLPA